MEATWRVHYRGGGSRHDVGNRPIILRGGVDAGMAGQLLHGDEINISIKHVTADCAATDHVGHRCHLGQGHAPWCSHAPVRPQQNRVAG